MRTLVAGGLAVLGVLLAVLGLAFPAAAAVACPTCYGFTRVAANVYVERAASADARSAVEDVVTSARDRIRTFYGRLDSGPKVMVCISDGCYRRVGGGKSRGMAVLDWALFLSPRGTTTTIASHELSHIELHHRIGFVRTFRRDIPQWFDEGLAVTISDDPRYLTPATGGDRCRIASDEALPAARQAWIETAQSHDLYAKAACRVSSWLARKGGAPAVVDLARRIDGGESFEAAYR